LGSKKTVTDQSSLEPPSDGKLVSANELEAEAFVEPSGATPEAIPGGSACCRQCGRHSVLVEPLSERKRIVALLKWRSSSLPHRSRSDMGSVCEYVKAIRMAYLGLPTIKCRFRREELALARHLCRRRIPPLHVEAALLVATARQLLRDEPHLKKPFWSLRDVVPLLEQARRSKLREGYVHYLRQKLRQALETKAPRR
jgi:hypothetical protein